MKNGIIYEIAEIIVKLSYRANIVEYFKNIANIFSKDDKRRIALKNIFIDIFIILKYCFILLLLVFMWQSTILTIIVWYLIIANVFTYFYYHLWLPPFRRDRNTQKRRFVNLFISFAFSNLSFFYLYLGPYTNYYSIEKEYNRGVSFFLYSMSNSLFGSFDPLKPINELGHAISIIQLSITFIFITILLSISIPQLKGE